MPDISFWFWIRQLAGLGLTIRRKNMRKSIVTKRSGCFYQVGKQGLYLFTATIILSLSVLHCRADGNTGRNYAFQRERMVVEQIEAKRIRNHDVLKAMKTVPRDQFVPEKIRHLAYSDNALPIGEGQTISQPYIVALMTDTIKPEKNMKVLEIGTGSGYQAAILAELCRSVYTIEIIEKLGRQAERILTRRYQNVFVKIGDGYQGWPEAAPFDAILVTCAPTKVPQPLAKQLKEGGRMVIPIG